MGKTNHISVYNKANTLMIDDTYSNLSMVSKKKLSTFSPYLPITSKANSFWWKIENNSIVRFHNPQAFNITGATEDIVSIVVSCKDFDKLTKIYYTRNPRDGTIVVVAEKETNIDDIYISFFTERPVSYSKNGIQVLNKEGNIVFDSNLKYLRIIGFGVYDYIYVPPTNTEKGIMLFPKNLAKGSWVEAVLSSIYIVKKGYYYGMFTGATEGITTPSFWNSPEFIIVCELPE